jgi:hypothetical protein
VKLCTKRRFCTNNSNRERAEAVRSPGPLT